jgi:hypothetical protein
VDEGNHRVFNQIGNPVPGEAVGLAIRHLPYRGAEHFLRKIETGGKALELATELPDGVGEHWRGYLRLLREGGRDAAVNWYKRYFYFEDPESSGLLHDPAPFCNFQRK